MKELIRKLCVGIDFVFGCGLMLSLAVGALSFLLYVAAIIAGGEAAAAICAFVYKGVYPVLIYCTSCLVLLGLLGMYLKGQTALSRKEQK